MLRVNQPLPSATDPVNATLRMGEPAHVIHRNIHGQFAEHLGHCIYGGLWVGHDSSIARTRGIRDDVVLALRKLEIPVLRWPGGCFADEYHWKDGIGPLEKRPKMINTHWGGVVENNHFGTHEFFDLCEQLGAEPYVCGNVGSGTVQEMMEWVEYMTSDAQSPMADLRRKNGRTEPWKLRYFGVGNESWGCGGNMRPEYYADNYRRYNTYVKNYGNNVIERIACGANAGDYEWTRVLMERVGNRMNGLSLHWYAIPTGDWSKKGSATQFDESEWHSTFVQTFRMKHLLEKHCAIMDEFDPDKQIALMVDEWGIWCDAEPGTNPGFLHQQNSLRDALAAAVNLNLFHHQCARVKMANIAQAVNVLQAMVLTDGAKMCLTPTYHTFEMYRPHKGARQIPVELDTPEYQVGKSTIPMLHASASMDVEGRKHISLVNLHPSQSACVRTRPLQGHVTGRILTATSITAHNDFENPSSVAPTAFTDFATEHSCLVTNMPPKSLVVLECLP